ncbi:MAG: hypothetical protein GPJ54_20525 [Candidatus Heimdallarchaeota archaeon]|nr:hypothetical protein [Candidatus Heimdallarchaeota archaeon]
MKSPINIVFIFLTILLISTTVDAHEAHTIEGEVDIIYEVTFSNNANNWWWDYSSSQSTPYHVETGTKLNLTISDVSDPQSLMNLSIGNATFLDFPDWEGEEALGMGYYKVPASFGFVANTSWTETKFAMDQSNLESFNFTLPHLDYLGGVVDSVVFEFKDVSQTTTLIYDQSSGILLESTSKVFGFDLSFRIYSINGDQEFHKVAETSSSTDETVIFNPFLITAGLILLVVKKKN